MTTVFFYLVKKSYIAPEETTEHWKGGLGWFVKDNAPNN